METSQTFPPFYWLSKPHKTNTKTKKKNSLDPDTDTDTDFDEHCFE